MNEWVDAWIARQGIGGRKYAQAYAYAVAALSRKALARAVERNDEKHETAESPPPNSLKKNLLCSSAPLFKPLESGEVDENHFLLQEVRKRVGRHRFAGSGLSVEEENESFAVGHDLIQAENLLEFPNFREVVDGFEDRGLQTLRQDHLAG